MAAPASLAGLGAPAPSPAPSLGGTFQDLSAELSPAWQLIDFAHRQIKKAIRLGGLYQQAEARAAVEAISNDLDRIITAYSKADPTVGPTTDGTAVAPPDEDASVEIPSP